MIGGGTLGYQIARLFEERDVPVRIVEHDAERAEWPTNRLGESRVIEADATDVDELGFDRLPDVDFAVNTLDDDTNYLLARLARELGAARIATTVDDPALLDLFEESDLDLIVHPQEIIAGEMLEVVYRQRDEAVAALEHDSATSVDTQTVTLDSNGEATVPVTLSESELDYFVTTVEDGAGDTGLTSDTVILDVDEQPQPTDSS